MREPRAVAALTIALLGWGSITAAAGYSIREQVGTVTAIADHTTVTDTLPVDSPGSISVTAGSQLPGQDYALASLLTEFKIDELHVVASADVGDWGNEGAAKILLDLQFSVSEDTPYTIDVLQAEATGLGWLGDRASIVVSDVDGIILKRNPGGGFDACNYSHPNAVTLCENMTFVPGVYTLEVRVSAYAPDTCGSCKGYAVTAGVEVSILF